ncbi:MAG: glycosyl hydrolase family 28 protein [Bacteroidales bacterium]|nr:glycosyl hydrolase family 28 protein [Bacteroidales bacterium]
MTTINIIFRKAACTMAAMAVLATGTASGRTYRVKGNTGEDIQALIDKAGSKGGGKVVVPAGVYPVGSIRLRSNVELHLKKDAVLLGGDKSEDYDSFPEEVCSIQPENSSKVLVYAYREKNIALTGEGVIDGQGPLFFDTTGRGSLYPKPPVERPRMVQFYDCEGIRLKGVTFKDSPCWTMFIRLCRDIRVDGITITADQKMINNDGIDFDGCRHVRVSNSRFKTCDDCLILRAMKENSDERIVCEDVIVTDCVLNSRCQTIRLGCPSDDTIRDAVFKDIVAEGNNGIFADYPARYLRSDDEGYMDISNIVFENYSGSFTGSAVQIVSEKGVKVRRVDGIVFRNFNVKSRHALRFIGNRNHEIGGVLLENFNAEIEDPGDPVIVSGCNGLTFKNVTLNGEERPDGPVAGSPGSDAPLVRGRSSSWETRKH